MPLVLKIRIKVRETLAQKWNKPYQNNIIPSSRPAIRIPPHHNTNPCSGKSPVLVPTKGLGQDNGTKNVPAEDVLPRQVRPFGLLDLQYCEKCPWPTPQTRSRKWIRDKVNQPPSRIRQKSPGKACPSCKHKNGVQVVLSPEATCTSMLTCSLPRMVFRAKTLASRAA